MIISSAIKYPNGKIYTGKRHCDCFKKAFEAKEPLPTKETQLKAGFCRKQGFITHNLEFVDRKVGAKLAIKCGQIKELKYSDTELFSEDLYHKDN